MKDCLNAIERYNSLNFERLSKEDFSSLHHWLNQPHVRTFYQHQAINLLEIEQKYTPRLESASIHCFIIYYNSVYIGYIQTYLVRDYPDYTAVIGTKQGATIDFYIGERAFLRKGLGYLIELKFLSEIVFLITSSDRCYISHDKDNLAALKASRRAGFVYVKDVVENNRVEKLFAISKGQVLLQTNLLLNSKT